MKSINKLLKQIEIKRASKMNDQIPFSALKNQWLKYLRSVRLLSAHTLTAYTHDFDTWDLFFRQHFNCKQTLKMFTHISRADIRAWVTHLRGQDVHVRTIARCVAALKNFTRYLIHERIFDDHPFLHFRLGAVKKRLPRALSRAHAFDVCDNIASLAKEDWIGARDESLVYLLYTTGLRISEALSIKVRDIEQSFLPICGKRNKQRHVPLLDITKERLRRYIRLCPFSFTADDLVFRGVRGGTWHASGAALTIRHYRRFAGLPETLTPHAFRHSCATHLVEASSDLRSIQELLGHAQLSSTQIYTDVAHTHVLSVYQKAHPRAKKENIHKDLRDN
jgi:integrase/recombinase XerC